MKTYRNEQQGFEINIPEEWSLHTEGQGSLIFKCRPNEAFNIQINPLTKTPFLYQIEDEFKRDGEKKGFTSLGLGRFHVGGEEHIWARFYIGGGLWSKKYRVILHGFEYMITATCLEEKYLLEMEKSWDEVVASFQSYRFVEGISTSESETDKSKNDSAQATEKLPAGMKIYRNTQYDFEMAIPGEWSLATIAVPGGLVFQCTLGESVNFQIGPIAPEPTPDRTERDFSQYAQHAGYDHLEFGRISVAGRKQVWARYRMQHGIWTKKYMLVLGGIEFAITATGHDQAMFIQREAIWDAAISSFRPLRAVEQQVQGLKTRRVDAGGEMYERAYDAVSNGDDAKARLLLEKCLSENPDHVLAHKELAIILKKNGDLQGALSHRREVKRLDPSDKINRYNFAYLLTWLGKREAALQEAEELQAMEPNNPGFQKLVNEMGRGKTHEVHGISSQTASETFGTSEEHKDEINAQNTLFFSVISYSLLTAFALLYIRSRVAIDILLSLQLEKAQLLSGSEYNGLEIILFYGVGAFICLLAILGVTANRVVWGHASEIFNFIEKTMQVKNKKNETIGGLVFSDYTKRPSGILDGLRLQISNLFHALIKISLIYFSVGSLGSFRSVIVAIVVFAPRLILGKSLPILWEAGISLFWFYSCYRAQLFWLAKGKGVARESEATSRDREVAISLPKASIQSAITGGVTPQFMKEILGDESVIKTIKSDLAKTGQIGGKEVWQLGLLTPDQDVYDPRPDPNSLKARTEKYFTDTNYRYRQMEQIPLKRTAVLNSKSYFNVQLNNILVYNGRMKYLGYPGWSYRLSKKMNRGEFINIGNVRIASDALHAQNRTLTLPGFLREDGFPLKEIYLDGDPLTAERDGTIVIDKDKVIVIHPKYYVQRRLIDDEGNLIEIGLEEEFVLGALLGVKMRPSVSELLFRTVMSNRYIPILRYRSFPYSSDFMFPILDTPMSANGWADLYIDPRGKGKLFIAKQKTEAEWYEMLAKLKELLYAELAKKDYHLLGLTKDKAQLNYYLSRKLEILKDYYSIQDWQLF